MLLVNGRITKKTFLRWSFLKNFSKKIFGKFDLCLVSNKETEIYLKDLGAKNIKNYGNLKFAKTKLSVNTQINPELVSKIKNRKIWCAASTHPTEEMFCAKTHMALKKTYKNALTIIIPRHVDPVKKISEELTKSNLKVSLNSSSGIPRNETMGFFTFPLLEIINVISKSPFTEIFFLSLIDGESKLTATLPSK